SRHAVAPRLLRLVPLCLRDRAAAPRPGHRATSGSRSSDGAAVNTLVTGGTGFIGAALVRALVSRGDRVRSLDNGSRGAVRRLGDAASEVELVNGDIRDGDAVTGAMQGIERVVHLAYVNGTEYFYERPELVLEVAVKGIVNVIDACISS